MTIHNFFPFFVNKLSIKEERVILRTKKKEYFVSYSNFAYNFRKKNKLQNSIQSKCDLFFILENFSKFQKLKQKLLFTQKLKKKKFP